MFVPTVAQYARKRPGVGHLSRGHGLGDDTLQGKLLLLQVVGSGLLDLELGHGVAQGGLDLLLLATLQLEGQAGVRDDVLHTGDVGLELLPRLELLAEGLVAGLELGGIWSDVSDSAGECESCGTYR